VIHQCPKPPNLSFQPLNRERENDDVEIGDDILEITTPIIILLSNFQLSIHNQIEIRLLEYISLSASLPLESNLAS
jgi:hypothetical protein